MIKIKNTRTSEERIIHNVICVNGAVMDEKGRKKGQRFIDKWSNELRLEEGAQGEQVFKLNDGWEIVTGNKAKKEPKEADNCEPVAKKAVKRATKKVEPKQQEEAVDVAAIVEDTPTGCEDMEKVKEELFAKYGQLGADMFEKVCAIAYNMKPQTKTEAKTIVLDANNNMKHVVEGVTCNDFEEIVTYIKEGEPVYMYGAAGCGKSHTAEQVAAALGLKFYPQSQILFAHDVKGYGDAAGRYVDTPFYRAFTEGGLFFIDEMDASAAEALVVLNTAIANGFYNFPVVGCVKAHPDFRVIAAGNTAMTGADVEYTARFVQDASTRNRFSFFEMEYDKRIELPIMARGDEEVYNFVCDLRNAIKQTGVVLCVSYRNTHKMTTPAFAKFGKEKALRRNVFAGMAQDELRIMYEALADKSNAWAVAMKNLTK